MKKTLSICFLLLFAISYVTAQNQEEYSSDQIYKKIQKLNFLGTVLYVGAHPDDENTAMISLLSNQYNARVAYLAMNRGDGGQNILGTEIREQLGVIRTEELLAARKVDNAEQFFTRANDFGFSKNPEETFDFWDRNKVLSDVVWAFRKFRPDVIINRFNHRTEGDTHGHHTASAILSVEAFDLSGNSKKFSNQLKYYRAWQPKRLYFNDSWFFYGSKEKYLVADHDGFLKLDLGQYLPIIGKSNTEISAMSRSQHKSQGFGVAGERGKDLSFLEPIKGDLKGADKDIFAGINTTWSRIPEGKAIGKILYKVQDNYDFTAPEKSIPGLLKAYKLIKKIKDSYWRNLKMRQIKEIIASAAGLYLEASSADEFGTLGEKLGINLEAINRSNADVHLKSVSFSKVKKGDFVFDKDLNSDADLKVKKHLILPKDLKYSNPYWLNKPHSLGMYTVEKQELIGLPETPPQLVATFNITINNTPLAFTRQLIYKTSTQIKGEVKEPFAVVPNVSVKMQDKVLVFPNNHTRKVKVKVKAYKDSINGVLQLKHPKNWKVSPTQIQVNLPESGKSKTLVFTLTPPENQDSAEITPEFTIEGKTYTKELHVITYPHIPTQTVLLPAMTKVNKIAIQIGEKNIAYIKGAGDEIPTALKEIGYSVAVLSGKDLTVQQLKKYDAVITGIRAYDVNKDLVLNQNVLFDYVKQGGTLLTQYSQLMGILTQKIAPYKMELSHDRVTDENSKVRFIHPDNPVLNTPNKITKADFKGWVQERGLYFPHSWSKEFTPILGMHDKGEKEMQGSLLIAKYGKGKYIYTGLSFFRELPAGVPGAYRLFANILAL